MGQEEQENGMNGAEHLEVELTVAAESALIDTSTHRGRYRSDRHLLTPGGEMSVNDIRHETLGDSLHQPLNTAH